jgi:hypothetical protein
MFMLENASYLTSFQGLLYGLGSTRYHITEWQNNDSD